MTKKKHSPREIARLIDEAVDNGQDLTPVLAKIKVAVDSTPKPKPVAKKSSK